MKFLITIVLLFWLSSSSAQNIPLTVISNPKGAPSEMKLTELRSILLGERQRWQNGKKIQIALMKTNTAVGKTTSEKIYNMSADELKKFWLALVFQGKAEAPTFFNTVSELQAFVSDNPGAIGIIDQPSSGNATNVILVDGKRTL